MTYRHIALSALAAAAITLTGCGGGGSSTPTTTTTGTDTTAPVVTLNGTSTVNLTLGDTYSETGATAIDDVDGALTPTVSGTVDTSTAGSYQITYSATDTAGNTGTVVRTVIVTDTTTAEVTLPSTITSNMTLNANTLYLLDGKVKVTNGATLTVEAGTTIAGKTPASFLVITPDSKLIAKGTQAEPIVFTSKLDVDGKSGDNLAGEWGGLILLGNAYTHYAENGLNKYEADTTETFGSADHTNDGESSGDLEYVLIKHSGFEVEKDKELNGLSLGGVGSGTTLKNIAIIGGLDDGVEIWGGTANIDGLYVYNAQDDSVDTDLGYRGTIQNVLVQQVNVDSTNNHDSAGMEFGNDHNTITTDDSNATQPTMINYTAYIKGGGISLKNDAGLIAKNVKFVSAKTADIELVDHRTIDAYDTNAVKVEGDLCFKDTATALTIDTVYAATNAKDADTAKTANTYWNTDSKVNIVSPGAILVDDDSCTGATEATIWKGKAGSNDPLETAN